MQDTQTPYQTPAAALPRGLSDSHAKAVPLLVFLAVTGFLALDALAPNIAPTATLWAAIALFFLGIPHGAVEPRHGIPQRPTLSYTALYLVAGIFVMCSWAVSPIMTLICFLALSAQHFGEAEPHHKILGPFSVLASLGFYPQETLEVFAIITGNATIGSTPTFSPELLLTAQMLGWASLFGLAISLYYYRHAKHAVLHGLSALAIFALLPPVPAVAVYYALIHSLREGAKLSDSVEGQISKLAKIYAPASLPALIGGGGLIYIAAQGWLPLPLVTGLAIAFAVPHMLPVHRLVEDI